MGDGRLGDSVLTGAPEEAPASSSSLAPLADTPFSAGQSPSAGGPFPADPPYLSQWGDLACNVAVIERGEDPSPLHDWRADGYLSGDAYRLWSRNTCGLTCLQMILAADPERWPDVPCKGALVAQAVSRGVLTPQDDGQVGGLYYAPFVRWVAHDFGLEAVSRPELGFDEIVELVSSGEWYVMASVSYEIRLPDQPATHRGGHLVLVFRAEAGEGAEENEVGLGELAGPAGATDSDGKTAEPTTRLVFHNPSGLPGTAEAASVTREQFERFYAGRGILVRRGR